MCVFLYVLDGCCLFFVIIFFFFKQRTAYEWRFSDWSSDVCSSDLVGVCLVIGLYALLVGRAFWIGYRCVGMRRHFAGYCAFGVALAISLQAFVSIGVNLGILPTKGLTLPLISSGGSSVLMTCAALGLLLRVSYELDRAERQVARLRRSEEHTSEIQSLMRI